MDGYIKIHRKILVWGWYKNQNTKDVFLHLLLKANITDKVWEGQECKRGQLITSYQHLAEDLNISVEQVRTALKHLKSTGEITYSTNHRNTIITICNYNEFQSNNTLDNRVITESQQSDNRVLTTTKESKESKESKYIKKDSSNETENELYFREYAHGNEELFQALISYEKMRTKIKKPLVSTRALKMLTNKLDGLVKSDDEKIELIDLATSNNWQSIYLPDDFKFKNSPIPQDIIELARSGGF